MVALRKLLARGYFPKELPPTFTTVKFADVIVAHLASLPAAFNDRKRWDRLCLHSLARPGNVRRRLAIPNPVPQFNIAKLVATNWKKLGTLIRRSALSQSRSKVARGDVRALVPHLHDGGLPEVRARTRCAGRYLLRTDIANFYHSIYTHSIPWATDTKAVAKKKHHGGLGNDLDQWVRNAQDGQTIGIPIGPDTSLAIAELILSDVDAALAGRIPGLTGCRYFDDYELTFKTRAEADAALAALQELLAASELQLNSKKTRIDELPLLIEKPWISEIRSFTFRDKIAAQRTDVIHFFDRVFQLSREYEDDNVMEYAVGRLRGNFARKNWSLLQSMLLQVLMVSPSAARECFRNLLRFRDIGYAIDKKALESTLNAIIEQHAPLLHGSEVSWAIWAAMVFAVPIAASAAKAMCAMEDSVTALLALNAHQKGLIPAGFDSSVWQSSLDSDGLRNDQWLLSYEARVQGWLPSVGGGDHVASDSCFGFLQTNGVKFYQPVGPTIKASAIPRSPIPLRASQ